VTTCDGGKKRKQMTMASQKQQNSAKSFENFGAFLELMITSDVLNEKVSSLAKSVHKKYLEIFW
jgi:hypothetical protein